MARDKPGSTTEKMHFEMMKSLLNKGRQRWHLIGSESGGIVACLDLEGRLFALLDGEVLNRVNPDAFTRPGAGKEGYLNPGGDGLWPAPEGTCMGYQYATGRWRVPPGLVNARYQVISAAENDAVISAEVDLINAQGLGIPVKFERRISVEAKPSHLSLTTTESFQYLAPNPLKRSKCLLAPWSLSQFDCGPGCEVVFPAVVPSSIWDLYDPSDDQRTLQGDLWHARTEGNRRYQIGLSKKVDWIEYVDPRHDLRVRRTAGPLGPGLNYIDIADKPPDVKPSRKGAHYSVYNDANGFMEIEAVGGCTAIINPGMLISLEVSTVFRKNT